MRDRHFRRRQGRPSSKHAPLDSHSARLESLHAGLGSSLVGRSVVFRIESHVSKRGSRSWLLRMRGRQRVNPRKSTHATPCNRSSACLLRRLKVNCHIGQDPWCRLSPTGVIVDLRGWRGRRAPPPSPISARVPSTNSPGRLCHLSAVSTPHAGHSPPPGRGFRSADGLLRDERPMTAMPEGSLGPPAPGTLASLKGKGTEADRSATQ